MFPDCVICKLAADPMAVCRGCKGPMCDECATPRDDVCDACRAASRPLSPLTLLDVVVALSSGSRAPVNEGGVR